MEQFLTAPYSEKLISNNTVEIPPKKQNIYKYAIGLAYDNGYK
jgi:hypothetical protein